MYDKETGVFTHEHKQKLDESLAKKIIDFCTVNKLHYVADLGCSNGRYCNYLTAHGNLACVGYEGNSNIKREYSPIHIADLSKPLHNGLKYDLVLCLEVGEHIPPEKSDIFLDNVISFAKKDILLSWATPERKGGGIGHVNERTNSEVIAMMESKGFQFSGHVTEIFREACSVRWFKTNLMCFWR